MDSQNFRGLLHAIRTYQEQKSQVEQKSTSLLDFDFQCKYKP